MINKINTLRIVAGNLTSHLFMEGKTKIKKPGLIIPGAIAAAGTVLTLETKDNNANLTVEKDNKEIQRAEFSYEETSKGYELVSAVSTYFYDDKDNKEIRQNHYVIDPEQEKVYEHSINYTSAPIEKSTRTYIDNINSAVAQTAGYKSTVNDYDALEYHTYGKKSLKRDIPVLLKILDVIAPNADFTIKMKEKLKKDNKTSLVAFEANDIGSGNKIVRGFMSANGDSVSYHIDTENMTIVGEQGSDKDVSRAYLKSGIKDIVPEETIKDEIKENNDSPNTVEGRKSVKTKTEQKKSQKKLNTKAAKPKEKTEPASPVISAEQTDADNHVYTLKYYKDLITKANKDKKCTRTEKVDIYKKVLADAYVDGYSKSDLENKILEGFSYYCKKTYVEAAIALLECNDVKPAAEETLDDKINILKNATFDIDDEALKICILSMFNDIAGIQDLTEKESCVNAAFSLLRRTPSENLTSDLLSFIKESSNINDDFKLHYEIYEEAVNNKKIDSLRTKVGQMINNISDSLYHEKRDDFLSKLYLAKDINDLVSLRNEVQELLFEQTTKPKDETFQQEKEQTKRPSIDALSSSNQKLVDRLLKCTSPRNITLTFEEASNLLKNIGFVETNVSGTHHKFVPPFEIVIDGRKQSFITISSHGVKTSNPAMIEDLIHVCRQYYGS